MRKQRESKTKTTKRKTIAIGRAAVTKGRASISEGAVTKGRVGISGRVAMKGRASISEGAVTKGRASVRKAETKPSEPPKLARRSLNRKSSFKSGRTIGEKRERLETANERSLARAKDKKRARRRVLWTIFSFLFVVLILVAVGFYLFGDLGEGNSWGEDNSATEVGGSTASSGVFTPSVEVYDEGTGQPAVLTARMREYIGQAEADFAELGYKVLRVVLPLGAVREMDFYLEDVPGYLKLILDRGTGVSVEDADRMLRYLASQGISEFLYIDVRLDGRAYWR